MKFSDLNLSKPLLNALEDLGFEAPTTIQERAFPVLMSGRDMMGIAQTGTGKTFAYALPLLRILPFSSQPDPRILVLVPTRELVEQTADEIRKAASYMNVRVEGVYGGINMNKQKERILQGLDILVATPGRLLDLALNGALKLRSIQKLVIDEVDEMMNLGFRTQLNQVLDMLPEKRQNLLFSATMTEEVETLAGVYFKNPIKIEAAPTGTPLEQIELSVYEIPNFNSKVNLLLRLLDDIEMHRVLVFAGGRKLADLLFETIEARKPGLAGIIHSNKAQNARFSALRNFQAGESRVLIATDLVARGLDIADVSHVINFDIPVDPLLYMHRIGRTGRADKKGMAITFRSSKEKVFLDKIEKLIGKKLLLIPLPERLEISDELQQFEMPVVHADAPELLVKSKIPTGAFHEKKDKNKKVNLGGSYKRKIKEKYKKPIKKGSRK